MSIKRVVTIFGAVASAVVLSTVSGTYAQAASFDNLTNESAIHTNTCLAASGNAHDAQVILWTCDAEGGQHWYTHNNNDAEGSMTLTDGNGDCLGVYGASQAKGANVVAWACNGNQDQKWVYTIGDSGWLDYQNLNSGQCLSVAGGATGNGSRAIQWTCQDTADQNWAWVA